jgi:hypothetical protein
VARRPSLAASYIYRDPGRSSDGDDLVAPTEREETGIALDQTPPTIIDPVGPWYLPAQPHIASHPGGR